MLENYKTIYAGGEGRLRRRNPGLLRRCAWGKRGGRSCFHRGNEEEILGRQT